MWDTPSDMCRGCVCLQAVKQVAGKQRAEIFIFHLNEWKKISMCALFKTRWRRFDRSDWCSDLTSARVIIQRGEVMRERWEEEQWDPTASEAGSRDNPQPVTGCYTSPIATAVDVHAVHSQMSKHQIPPCGFAQTEVTFTKQVPHAQASKLSRAIISRLHLPGSAHQLKSFFNWFYSTLHSGAFRWTRSAGAQATALVNNTAHSRPDSPVSHSVSPSSARGGSH